MLSESTHPQRSNTLRHSFLAAKSHRVPRLVKALDRSAAHVRAALTSLGTRMQKHLPLRTNASVCSICQPFRCLPSPSSIRQRKPPRTRTTTSSFGTKTSSFHNRVLEGVQRADCCHPYGA